MAWKASGKSFFTEPVFCLLQEGKDHDYVTSTMRTVGSHLANRRGVEIGTVNILVEAKLLQGQRYASV